MRKEFSAGILAVLTLASSPAEAEKKHNFNKGKIDKLKDEPKMTCQPEKYKQKNGELNKTALDECNTCKTAVEKWREKLATVANNATAKESSLVDAGSNAAQGIADDSTGSPSGVFTNTAGLGKIGNDTSGERNKNALGAKAEFDQCKSDISEACGSAQQMSDADKKPAQDVLKACAEASNNAKDAAQGNGNVGDMMKSLGDMAKAAAAAMKSPKQDQAQQPEAPATSPTPDQNVASPPEIEQSRFNDKNGLAQSQVGFAATDPIHPLADGSGPTSGLSGMGGASRAPASTAGALPPAVGGTPPGSGEGGGGASGGGGGGGAPTPETATAAAETTKDSSYEINGGGGMRMSSGYKSGKGDLADLGAAAPGDLPAPEDLVEQPAAAVNSDAAEQPEDGDSIFRRIQLKYGNLQGAGRI
jgi:hypothetical protein